MKKIYLILSLFLTTNLFAQTEPGRSNINSLMKPFYHGVASGDPLTDRVIIWTRITPDSTITGNISVDWRMALDTAFTQIVTFGTTSTNELTDYTVKVDVTGLLPNTFYFYEFSALNGKSVIGRTKTAPSGDVDSLRFAVVSCSNYEYGYFNAYKRIAQRNDIDAVLHLGDYIYEYGVGSYSGNVDGRTNEPEHEIITLEDYRIRHSHYRLDPDLRRVHQQYPFIVVWDDHESANDSWKGGAENHDPATEGDWSVRKANSIQSYFEWMPIRVPDPNDNERIYRQINYGDLVNFLMIDTRLYGRDLQVGTTSPSLNDPGRSLLGASQYSWMMDKLENSTSRWNILGQQVMMAPLKIFGTPVNTDQWDGYPVERSKLLNEVVDKNIPNLVVLTGDIHTSWANDLPLSGYNASTGANSAGVEFVATSVTSPGAPIGFGTSVIKSANPHMKYIELSSRGYLILDINKTRTQADWFYTIINTPSETDQFAISYRVNDGERFLRTATGPSVRPGAQPIPAPNEPQPLNVEKQDQIVVVGQYPNPFIDKFVVQFYMQKTQVVTIRIIDMTGKIIMNSSMGEKQTGLHYAEIRAEELAAGTYFVILETPENRVKNTVVKVSH
jgi:alkaline phosphatase D